MACNTRSQKTPFPDGPDLIKTVRGSGYVFAAGVAAVETGA
jgi:hypothetical protein